jgi:hypothetical protein
MKIILLFFFSAIAHFDESEAMTKESSVLNSLGIG